MNFRYQLPFLVCLSACGDHSLFDATGEASTDDPPDDVPTLDLRCNERVSVRDVPHAASAGRINWLIYSPDQSHAPGTQGLTKGSLFVRAKRGHSLVDAGVAAIYETSSLKGLSIDPSFSSSRVSLGTAANSTTPLFTFNLPTWKDDLSNHAIGIVKKADAVELDYEVELKCEPVAWLDGPWQEFFPLKSRSVQGPVSVAPILSCAGGRWLGPHQPDIAPAYRIANRLDVGMKVEIDFNLQSGSPSLIGTTVTVEEFQSGPRSWDAHGMHLPSLYSGTFTFERDVSNPSVSDGAGQQAQSVYFLSPRDGYYLLTVSFPSGRTLSDRRLVLDSVRLRCVLPESPLPLPDWFFPGYGLRTF